MSDLLHMNGIPTFKSSKGLRYPKYFEYAKQHDDMHWRSSEIVLGQDIQDFAKASQEEKDLITKILRLFTQNEIQVNYGYSKMLNIFKPYEVQAWLFAAGQREFTHVENYSLFTETIGLPDSIYQEFLDIPQMSAKAEYLEKAKIKKYEDYKALGLSNVDLDKVYRKDVARMIAVYAGGTENISLMAQFAMLLKFQFEGKYPGLCTIVEWSINNKLPVLVSSKIEDDNKQTIFYRMNTLRTDLLVDVKDFELLGNLSTKVYGNQQLSMCA